VSQAGPLNNNSGSVPPDVPITFVTNSGDATAASNVIEILGSAGVTTTGSGNVITITSTGAGFTWNVVTSATNPNQIVANNGYICSGSSMTTFLLPLTATVGDTFKIFSYSSLFQIIPNGAQNLVIGAVTGKVGATGTATSNSPGDAITMTYMGGNTFQSEAPQGTLTLVYS
jgi:hypothetical protein